MVSTELDMLSGMLESAVLALDMLPVETAVFELDMDIVESLRCVKLCLSTRSTLLAFTLIPLP
jgi:hypothetical protein